ncbi:MAG: hypothetical protein Q9213_002798 [Squamulea squamosa]
MEVFRQSLIPGRVSQLYADTKRSYEHMIQNNVLHASQTVVHTKLRIQKDRLIAWGLEWADANTTQGDDIDDSLDRAGISDLVSSIMSSIQDLLERADGIHPHRTISFPGAFPEDKPALTARNNAQWTPHDLATLSDIVKDLTASIDTLCDLSRSRQALNKPRNTKPVNLEVSEPAPRQKGVTTPERASLIHVTRIDEALLQIPDDDMVAAPASSLPPSYETVAAGSEDRILAYMTSTNKFADKSTRAAMPVLLEYIPVIDVVSTGQHQSPAERYNDLLQVEPTILTGLGPTYLGTLKLLGWVQDSRRARNALVYVVPLPRLEGHFGRSTNIKPSTLLSFLHHAADTDSTNMPSLEDRFRLAFNLTSSLLHLHAKGLLHRNINSRNVVFFTNDTGTPSDSKPWKNGSIRRPFLTSFDQCSEDVYEEIEEPFISNIYRHPHIERGQRSLFKPSYDYYSLGLLLLEVGLWMPISKLWKTRYTRANFKTRLQTIYARKLEGKCGTNYMNVVDFCLTVGDQQQPDKFKSTFTASQNIMYWKAFKILEKCCMIDVAGEIDEDLYALSAGQPQSFDSPARTPLADDQTTSNQAKPKPKARAPAFDLSTAHLDFKSKAVTPTIDLSTAHAEQPSPPAANNTCKCKVWSHDIPAAFATHWQQSLEPKLNRMFSKIIDRWESYSIELLMAGETAELARPTIYMVCASVEKARKVLQYVNQDQGLFDIKVSRGSILRSKAGKNKRKRGKGKRGPSSGQTNLKDRDQERDQIKRFSHYQERPVCGASIGAYLDEQHLPPVSFGGTVLVNGEPYGMSVHHMLENDDIDYGLDDFDGEDPLQRSMAPKGLDSRHLNEDTRYVEENAPYLEDVAPPQWTSEPPEALYPFEISDSEDEGYLSDFDPSQWDTPSLSDLSDLDMGDTPGIEPGQGETLLVTQPAIDDVDEGFFPNESDIDEDHLASHTLGYIHASSGIKRTRRDHISHEVDWALIKMRSHRSHSTPSNTIKNGTRHCHTANPRGIIRADSLGGLKVHALGRTSGLQTGTILPTMVMVKMPGRISHSQSWQVAGNFGVGGDSGAWVIDNATGGVCAHVLAWSQRNNTTYVAPMEVLFEDMARTLGTEVELPPGGQTVDVVEDLASKTAELGVWDTRTEEEDSNSLSPSLPAAAAHLSRESTTSPPIATSPPPPPPPSRSLTSMNSSIKTYSLESKRKSGSEMLIEKGEERLRVNCHRMSIG